MAYEKQTWNTGDTITANKLNHMEDGIAAGGASYDLVLYETNTSEGFTLEGHGLSFEEILDKIENGEKISVLYSIETEATGDVATSESLYYASSTNYGTTDKTMTISGMAWGNSVDIVTYTQASPSSVMITGTNNYSFTYDATTKEYTFTPA